MGGSRLKAVAFMTSIDGHGTQPIMTGEELRVANVEPGMREGAGRGAVRRGRGGGALLLSRCERRRRADRRTSSEEPVPEPG